MNEDHERNFKRSALSAVCHGCLSSDRKLTALGEFHEMFHKLCFFGLNMQPVILFCWECQAVLRKTKIFMEKVQVAQSVLSYGCTEIEDIEESLSTLKRSQIYITEDFEFKHKEGSDGTDEFNTKHEEIEIQIKEEPNLNEIDTDNNIDIEPIYLNDIKDQGGRNTSKKKVKTKRRSNVLDKKQIDLNYIEIDKSEADVKRVKRKRKKEKQCRKCHLVFPNFEDYFQHFKDMHKPFKCDYCKKAFIVKTNLEQHINLIHLNVNISCDKCKKRFSSAKQLEYHKKYHHEVEKSEVSYCAPCDKQFLNVLRYRIHLSSDKAHAGDRKEGAHLKYFSCEQCTKRFSTAKQLDHHIKYHHEINRTEESFCVSCNRQFNTILQYKMHLTHTKAHAKEITGNTDFDETTCPECGKLYSTKKYMESHYKFYHLGKSHECDLCGKTFITNSKLNQHKKYVHENYLKPKDKLCSVCGKGFTTNQLLKIHVRIHTGEKPYKCEQCDSTFAQRSTLATHVKLVHLNIKGNWKKKKKTL